MKLLRHDLHILTGAYAVDAIDEPERERFEHHLRRCKPCGNEVRGLRETATRLALAAATAPPPQLRGRVMALAAATRQLPPLVYQRARREPRAVWSRRLVAAAVVVLLGVAIALGIAQIRTRRQLDTAQAQNRAIAAVLAAPDARVATASSTQGGTATVVISQAQQKMIFTTTGLPRLPASKVYELWLIGPPGIRPAGLLPAPSAGQTAPVLDSGVQAGDKVGMTVEPAGGTRTPTTKPILVMSLPA